MCSLGGCFRQPTRFVPPRIPEPDTDFIVVRDVTATWNALLRALEKDPVVQIASVDRSRRKITLKAGAVDLQTYCDCGHMGKIPLSGRAWRRGTITLSRRAPQETMVHVATRYTTTHDWKDADGHVVRTETIPCVSNGRLERRIYEQAMRFLAP